MWLFATQVLYLHHRLDRTKIQLRLPAPAKQQANVFFAVLNIILKRSVDDAKRKRYRGETKKVPRNEKGTADLRNEKGTADVPRTLKRLSISALRNVAAYANGVGFLSSLPSLIFAPCFSNALTMIGNKRRNPA